MTKTELKHLIREAYQETLEEEQLNEIILPLLRGVLTAGRVIMPKIIAAAPAFSKVVQRTAVPVAAGYGITQLTQDLSKGAGEVYTDVKDAAKEISDKVGEVVDGKTVFELATLAVKYSLPIGIVLAILYGGKKLIDKIMSTDKQKINSLSSLPLAYYDDLRALKQKYGIKDDGSLSESKKDSEPKSEPKKEDKPEKKKSGEETGDSNKITKNFIDKIEKHEKRNQIQGDKKDAKLFGKISKMLRKRVGQILEKQDVDAMIAELDCEECYEETVEEKLDPVGKEDGDINNDGKKDGTDKYLMKRRKAIGAALDKAKKIKSK